MAMSKIQENTMIKIQALCVQFKENRWFTQNELMGVTKHTLDALVESRGMLEDKMSGEDNRIRYFRMSPEAVEKYAVWV